MGILDTIAIVATFLFITFPYPFIGVVFSLPAIVGLLIVNSTPAFKHWVIIGLVASTAAFFASALITARTHSRLLFPPAPSMEIFLHEDKIEDVRHEAWLRSIVPPLFWKDCFSSDNEVCEAFEDGSMMMRGFDHSWASYLGNHLDDTISFGVCFIIVGAVSYVLRRRD